MNPTVELELDLAPPKVISKYPSLLEGLTFIVAPEEAAFIEQTPSIQIPSKEQLSSKETIAVLGKLDLFYSQIVRVLTESGSTISELNLQSLSQENSDRSIVLSQYDTFLYAVAGLHGISKLFRDKTTSGNEPVLYSQDHQAINNIVGKFELTLSENELDFLSQVVARREGFEPSQLEQTNGSPYSIDKPGYTDIRDQFPARYAEAAQQTYVLYIQDQIAHERENFDFYTPYYSLKDDAEFRRILEYELTNSHHLPLTEVLSLKRAYSL